MDKFHLFVLLSFVTSMKAQKQIEPLTNNKTFIVSSIIIEPFLMFSGGSDDPDKGNDRFDGYIPDLMRLLAEKFDMKYEIKLVKDGRFGSLSEEGSWNGMIGEVIRSEADIAAAPLTVTSQRERVVDFSKPFMQSGVAMVMSKKLMFGQASWPLGHLLQTFQLNVWIFLIVVAVVVWVFLVFLRRFHPDENKGGKDTSLLEAAEAEIKGFISKNTHHHSCARRVLLITSYIFWLFVFLLYVIALFWCFHAPVSPSQRIYSADDIVGQSSIKPGAVENASTIQFFRSSKEPGYKKIWHIMNSDRTLLVKTITEGLERARRDEYAFFADVLTFSVNRKPCDLVQVGNLLNSVGYAMAVRIRSPLRYYIDLALLELIENGNLDELRRKWWRSEEECVIPSVEGKWKNVRQTWNRSSSTSSVGIDYFYLPFLILIFGIVMSFLMMLFRIIGPKILRGKRTNASESQLPLNEENKKLNENAEVREENAQETVEINA